MDICKIKKLIELVKEFDISDLEISEGEKSVRINRCYTTQSTYSSNQRTCVPSAKQPLSASLIKTTTAFATVSDHLVRSPMVGTFYRTASPDAKPFVEIGQKVNIGDTLCVVEAMKMMNQIQSDKAGIIKAIIPNNGQPVEFDEPLIIIE
ncbi:acetyl-CoA carboxylase biotin carboxyl carrier protein [Sodalis sp. CWE]|uniref:acetyl-CoA carboxylase biotin carboxyl carrier protein n=1 Tax=Sodalis sp. CWE TaxID=2803816 RepID=UPI001C7CC20B|nr:acetyl-CoA carboxylase biotin carboxyl carrier protein [Sodalis sp. CWE]MBX4180854.1 acetyl-CoA carboxylase biotin carboxyl carrier protein [Sodalis sp. CWE]